MGFLDLFIKTNDDSEQKPQQTDNNAVPVQSPQTPIPATPVSSTISNIPQPVIQPTATSDRKVAVDMEIVKSIYQDLIDGCAPGGYLELKQNAEALNSMGLTDEQRFMAAFKVLRARNPSLTKEDMLKSVSEFVTKLSVINSEAMSQCDEKLRQIKQETVDATAKANETIESRRKAITELRDKIAEHERVIAEQTVDVEHAAAAEARKISDLMHDRDVFELSVQHVSTALTNDQIHIQNIN